MSTADTKVLKQLTNPEHPARVPVFDRACDLMPTFVSDWNPTVDQLMAIVDKIAQAGFTRVRSDRPPTATDLHNLTNLLTLGEPVDQALPAPGDVLHADPGMSTPWTPTVPGQSAGYSPPSAAAQDWHTDGAAYPLGEIRTSLHVCLRPALVGGATLLFNATAAFVDLAQREPEAAAALMAPDVLTCPAIGSDDQGPLIGPAFGLVHGHLLTRCCGTGGDRWQPAPDSQLALRRGLAELNGLAWSGSPHYLEFTMVAGEVLVLADARLCHGRSVSVHDPAEPRTVRRFLLATDLVIAGR